MGSGGVRGGGGESRNTPSHFMVQKPETNTCPMAFLASMQTSMSLGYLKFVFVCVNSAADQTGPSLQSISRNRGFQPTRSGTWTCVICCYASGLCCFDEQVKILWKMVRKFIREEYKSVRFILWIYRLLTRC